MKYKIGDKVEIKKELIPTWSNYVKDFFQHPLSIILTIREVCQGEESSGGKDYYLMEEITFQWFDYDIKCLIGEESKEEESIKSRFEILDF